MDMLQFIQVPLKKSATLSNARHLTTHNDRDFIPDSVFNLRKTSNLLKAAKLTILT